MSADTRARRVVVAGGGTGGHLYPGIAVARELQAQHPGTTVTFAGTARGIEARVVPREGFELDVIRSAGLKGKSLGTRLRGAALLPLSAVDAWRLVSRRKPDLVIGVGGYSSGPVVATAALRGIPTLLLEQNAVPGLTNRLLAPLVRAAAVTYETTLPFFRGKGFRRRQSRARRVPSAADPIIVWTRRPVQRCRVLIFGGSQGARAINVACVEAAPKLAASATPLAVTHQTGERDLEMVREGYRRAGLDARVEPFLLRDGPGDERRRPGDLSGRRDHAGRDHGIGETLDPDPAADGHRRSPAEERRGARTRRRRRGDRPAGPERRIGWPRG